MENENRLTFIDDDGNEILCEILFTFESKEFNKNYVLFYPVEGDEEDVEVMAASYVPTEDGEGDLQAIETDEEWEMIEKVLDQFEADQEHDDCDCEEGDCDCEDCDCEEEDHECHCGHDHNHDHE